MKKPSEEINKIGEESELQWLRQFNNKDYDVKPSLVVRLRSEVNYMKKFLDEIYKTINKKI